MENFSDSSISVADSKSDENIINFENDQNLPFNV